MYKGKNNNGMQIIQTSYNFISDAPEKFITKSCTATVDARVLHNNDANDRAFKASTNYQLINSFNILVFGYFSRQIHGALFALICVERYNIDTTCTSRVR